MGNSKTKAIAPAERAYRDQLDAEVATWCIADDDLRQEKVQRERIRHHKLIKDLLLDRLDTHLMDVLEVGGGPSPVTDLIEHRTRIVVDPCADDYADYFPIGQDQLATRVEGMGDEWDNSFDLIVCTNALDHVQEPEEAVRRMARLARPGGFIAVMCAENNAITNPHPCHIHNLTATHIHDWLDDDFETVWELTFRKDRYRYGWVKYQGKRGQPAFALLMRKCAGYA